MWLAHEVKTKTREENVRTELNISSNRHLCSNRFCLTFTSTYHQHNFLFLLLHLNWLFNYKCSAGTDDAVWKVWLKPDRADALVLMATKVLHFREKILKTIERKFNKNMNNVLINGIKLPHCRHQG